MGKKKITCKNISCKHWSDSKCNAFITIDELGKCGTFEKGFTYYFHLVWNELGTSNFIDASKLQNTDLKIGLYYVMECYDISFSIAEWGTSRFVMLVDDENSDGLTYDKIIKRNMNLDKFSKHYADFQKGILPINTDVIPK